MPTIARDRGHVAVADLVEARRGQGKRTPPADQAESLARRAASANDVTEPRRVLDADSALVHVGDRKGATPLHRAVLASAHDATARTAAPSTATTSCGWAKTTRSYVGCRPTRGRVIDRYGYTPVFIACGIMPLIAAGLVVFVMGPLRPLPEFQDPHPAAAQ